MRALARFSLAHRALIALITVFCTVFGVIAAGQLKQELIPSLELPVISVTTVYPGAGPEVVDKSVGEPLERALQAVERPRRVQAHVLQIELAHPDNNHRRTRPCTYRSREGVCPHAPEPAAELRAVNEAMENIQRRKWM